MLPLTPLPLQTDGERALFAELVRWDTGGSVRAAVVASIPFTDGPLNRRLADAVLLVPEGIAVVRIVEVRQSGVVTAKPEGAWTIGPEGRPGDVLQLAGGGSTPLDGLMRAGMEAAVRLRRAGLEPGRIGRLTVLAGDVSGLVPADGDLGEGDQVALLEPRSLLLGIARASRYAGVDNPRLWTTADVRAALEALGLQGRGPSVEELNGEGFPYSPYVLRRPELLAPAAMTASSVVDRPAVPAPPPPKADEGTGSPEPDRSDAAAIARAVAASVAAAHAAATAPPEHAPVESPAPAPGAVPVERVPADASTAPADPPSPAPVDASTAAAVASPAAVGPVAAPVRRDTVAVDGQPTPPGGDGGIGGLFANAEPLHPVPAASGAQAAPAAPAATQPPAGASAAPRTAVFPAASPAPPAVPPARPEGLSAAWGPLEPDQPSGSRRTVLLVAVAVLLVVLLGAGGWLVARGPGSGKSTQASAASSQAHRTPAGPKAGDVQTVSQVAYTVAAIEVDRSCAAHAYGQVADFFATTDCRGMSRALYSADLSNGGPVVVSVSRVRMSDDAAARNLRALADRNGSGNVSDLLREGVRYPGGPERLAHAEYASAVSGPTVTIVESAWVHPDGGGNATDLDLVASNGLALKTAPIPAG